VLDDLPVTDSHDVDELEFHLLARRRDAHEVVGVRAAKGLLRHHLVALGDLIVDLESRVSSPGS
jgi:hypothetical protein